MNYRIVTVTKDHPATKRPTRDWQSREYHVEKMVAGEWKPTGFVADTWAQANTYIGKLTWGRR